MNSFLTSVAGAVLTLALALGAGALTSALGGVTFSSIYTLDLF